MTFGHWASRFPMKLGGGGHKRVEGIYKALRADRPEPLRAAGGEADLEDKTMALAIARVYDLTDARVVQGQDPGKATGERLARWERIFGITPDAAAGEAERRAIVAARNRAKRSNRPADVYDALAPLFREVTVLRPTVVDVPGGLMHRWPGGAGTADRPGTADASAWTSDLGRLVFSVRHLPGLDRPARKRREAAATDILQRMLPVSVTFVVQDADGGFQLGVETFPGTF
jgi:hypothetical protein